MASDKQCLFALNEYVYIYKECGGTIFKALYHNGICTLVFERSDME